MLHDRLVSALVKAGATVTEEEERYFCMSVSDPSTTKLFSAEKNGKRIEWITHERFPEKLGEIDERLYVSYVALSRPDTNAMSDYFVNTSEETIKGAVRLLS